MRDRYDSMYLRTLDELEQRVRSGTPYDVLRGTVSIRQLIADGGNSLALRCNRGRGLKLRFESLDDGCKPPEFEGHPLIFSMFNPDVSAFPKAQKKAYPLDAFLAMETISFKGTWFSLKKVLDFCAYVLGGIHMRDPETPEEHLLLELDNIARNIVGEGTPVLLILRGMVQVTLDGLAPLTVAVRL